MQNIYGLKVKDGLDIYETDYSDGYFEFSKADYSASELNEELLHNRIAANSLIFIKTGVKTEENDGELATATPIYQRAIIIKVNHVDGPHFEFGYLGEDGLPVIYEIEQSEEDPKDFKVYTPAIIPLL